MLRTWIVGLGIVAISACSSKKAGVPEAAAQAPPAPAKPMEPPVAQPVTPASVVEPSDARRDRDRGRPKLRLTLRSTPPGANASIDGRPVGQTPLIYEIDADGKVHEFTFALAGHAIERYRFPPVQDGVVHAQLRPLSGPADAGVP